MLTAGRIEEAESALRSLSCTVCGRRLLVLRKVKSVVCACGRKLELGP